ncbi:TetR/AcrR family transcriptional regulator [Vallitalea okinawensis]|uniref:TetR/AcrR family transcriptional regulator n=1 Tax=Vallitalea okinawensis TaxID=2078660 RepID=UPI000CFAA56B|nr:TetR/AcrR family transcriptional regulator [Vallitalea okinawensis]
MACLFEKLDRKKQERIINAALHVFSVNDYKNALTDDIAAKAEISKGSLFQYFKNKLSLYLHLYNFSLE